MVQDFMESRNDSGQEYSSIRTAFLEEVRVFFTRFMTKLDVIGVLDYDEEEDSVVVYLPDKRTYLLCIHKGMQQIWLSSPFSGGRHFHYISSQWLDTRNGQELLSVFVQEVQGMLSDPSALKI